MGDCRTLDSEPVSAQSRHSVSHWWTNASVNAWGGGCEHCPRKLSWGPTMKSLPGAGLEPSEFPCGQPLGFASACQRSGVRMPAWLSSPAWGAMSKPCPGWGREGSHPTFPSTQPQSHTPSACGGAGRPLPALLILANLRPPVRRKRNRLRER